MPDHFHLLISATLSLERSLQLIKGGFSYRATTSRCEILAAPQKGSARVTFDNVLGCR
jgi:hypothetical protein